MRSLVIIFATLVVGSLILAPGSTAQRRGMTGDRMYNPQTVETISGVVVSVGKFGGIKGMSQGIHAVIKTDTETISVHLGPAWFIDNQETKISPNDRVEVKGSRITLKANPRSLPLKSPRMDKRSHSEMRAVCPFGEVGGKSRLTPSWETNELERRA